MLPLALALLAATGPGPVALTAPGPAPGPAPAPLVSALEDPLDDLATWVERFRRGQRGYGEPNDARLALGISTARGVARVDGREGTRAAALVFLDMHAAGDAVARSGERPVEGVRIRNTARVELQHLIDEDLARWLASEVLVRARVHSNERRAAACTLLAERSGRQVQLALTLCAREDDEILRAAALAALAGRDDEALHGLFTGILTSEGAEAPPAVLGAIQRHFAEVRLAPGSRAERPFAAWVAEHLGSPSWRSASLAVALSHSLADDLCVPLLLDALDLWVERSEAGEPVRRMTNDVTRALEERSGRALGIKPENWRTWWAAVQRGEHTPRIDGDDGVNLTLATFFGLQPITDRVTFVIDCSGSMADPALTDREVTSAGGWTRYDEAVAQMLDLLEGLGERTRFNIVLFNAKPDVWRSNLTRATPANLRAARLWLVHKKPTGGTRLRQGFEAALGLKEGALELEQLEVDTLIVLCDGETTDGPDWIEPTLQRLNGAAQVLIHCVQVGPLSDGALELLARGTGGRYVVVD